MKNLSQEIADIVHRIMPYDALEAEHQSDVLTWIKSGAPLCRIQKPATPPKHLVSYFVLYDPHTHKILLVDHKKAQLWLPTGGHVEEGEHPKDTVSRECREELGRDALFLRSEPIFITQTITVGLTAGHTDVSLWYVLRGSCAEHYTFDADEFHTIRWFDVNDIPFERTDPHMQRFIAKLKWML